MMTALPTAFAPSLIALSVVAVSLGGLGGSWQLSRLCLLPLLALVLFRLVLTAGRAHLRGQLEILIFTLLLTVLATLSITWSVDKSATVGYLAVLIVNMAPLAMLGLVSPSELSVLQRWLPVAWLGAACVALPIAAYELLTGNHFALGLDERGGGVVSILPFASGLHGNFNDFSLFLVFCLFGVLMASGAERSARPALVRLMAGPVVLGLLSVILVNTSRGAILTAAGFLLARYAHVFRLSALPTIGAALAALAVLALAASTDASAEAQLLAQYLVLKFSDFSSDFNVEEGGRLAIVQACIQGLYGSFGLGVGAGANSAYLAIATDSPIPNPHNLLLEWALNFSVYGLLLLAWFAWRLWRISGLRPADSRSRLVRAFLLLLPLFGVIQSHLTGYTYFWLALVTAVVFAMEPRPGLNTAARTLRIEGVKT